MACRAEADRGIVRDAARRRRSSKPLPILPGTGAAAAISREDPSTSKFIRYRDDKGRFARRHAQRYIVPEVVDSKTRKAVRVGNPRRGIDAFDAWTLERTYAAPVFEVQPEIALHSFQSLQDTLEPAEERMKGYKLVDVEVWYGGERIVSRSKIALRSTGRKVRRRASGRWANETPMQRVRAEVKRALEEQGYAVTPQEVRAAWGDKRTKAFARDRFDYRTENRLSELRAQREKTKPRSAKRRAVDREMAAARAAGEVVRPKLKTIKPRIVIRGYK